MTTIQTYHIHLNGIVQGIGFRPHVAVLARQSGISGAVGNSGNGVHIIFNACAAAAESFYTQLIRNPPPLAKILTHNLSPVAFQEFKGFAIIDSNKASLPHILLTPDYAICPQCITELHDPNNKRFHYPFITCTQCGPRYSIATSLPYDREHTTMQDFNMCPSCREEYQNINNGRFHSQTNSCPDCGISMQLYTGAGQALTTGNREIIHSVVNCLQKGAIAAVKGIGGYVLLCDAANATAIARLRQRKNRPSKPFALLFKDLEQIRQYTLPYPEEENCLASETAPIVLLHNNYDHSLASAQIAPGLDRLGCMLPNSPLLHLIISAFGSPLICTSANISNSPILYKDEEALLYLARIADEILMHNREITMPQDDSVIQFATHTMQPVLLRRSRGFAPGYLAYAQQTDLNLLATGALMKSSFTLQTRGITYISQYLGSTHGLEAQETYTHTLQHVLQLLRVKPQQIITDRHPDYFSTQLAQSLSETTARPLVQVQHHKAHFAAVLAENDLLQDQEPVLGVIWDGTGLGDDGHIWGSEFFRYEACAMERCYHFNYFPQFLHDKMAREPRLSALAICYTLPGSDVLLKHKFTSQEWTLYHKMLRQEAGLSCSSMGRIFDAVAALLGLCDQQTYEGEAALYLQSLAEKYCNRYGYAVGSSYFIPGTDDYRNPTTTLFTGLLHDLLNKKDIGYLAAKFHYSLVVLIETIAGNLGIGRIAFSGGVFQNSFLVDIIGQQLQQKFKLYFHQQLSPNDENISFGQMVYFDNNIDYIQTMSRKNKIPASGIAAVE